MALSSAPPSFCLSPSAFNDVPAFKSHPVSHQCRVKVLPRISCKAEDTIGSKRRGRRGVSGFRSFLVVGRYLSNQGFAVTRVCELVEEVYAIGSAMGMGRKDPRMDERESFWPYLETQERMIVDLNKQVLVDTENLLARANNKFGLVLEIAEEANEYLRHNKDEALTRKPILKVISDRINEAAGENIRDAYCEETLDPQE